MLLCDDEIFGRLRSDLSFAKHSLIRGKSGRETPDIRDIEISRIFPRRFHSISCRGVFHRKQRFDQNPAHRVSLHFAYPWLLKHRNNGLDRSRVARVNANGRLRKGELTCVAYDSERSRRREFSKKGGRDFARVFHFLHAVIAISTTDRE